MAGKIQNRYSALVRELDITDYTPQYRMTDDVVPVVVLHEHCEGSCRGSAGTIGASGPTAGVASVIPERSGAHQILMFWDSYVAVGAAESAAFYLIDSANGTPVSGLWYFDFGYGGMERGNLLIPKIHIPENTSVRGDLLSTLAATNFLTMGLLLQPV